MGEKLEDKLAFIIGVDLEYDRKKKLCQRAIESVEREIKEYFDDINTGCIHYIKSRIKSRASILEKARREKCKNPMKELNDIAGLRVVCHNESDIEQVAAFIKLRYRGSIVKDEKLNRSDGYNAHHMVIKIQVLDAGQPDNIKVEVQLRTIAQDLFGTLSHRDIYKLSIALPENWQLKMKTLSDKLKEVDKLAEELKQEWIAENTKTKAKDQITAEAIIRICENKVNKKMSIENALMCLGHLIRQDIKKISELEAMIDNCEIKEAIDKLYLQLLGRKADINGKIIYGAVLFKFKDSTPETKTAVIGLIEDSVKSSPEYLIRRKEKIETPRFVKIDPETP